MQKRFAKHDFLQIDPRFPDRDWVAQNSIIELVYHFKRIDTPRSRSLARPAAARDQRSTFSRRL
jgi:hypothetical protein